LGWLREPRTRLTQFARSRANSLETSCRGKSRWHGKFGGSPAKSAEKQAAESEQHANQCGMRQKGVTAAKTAAKSEQNRQSKFG